MEIFESGLPILRSFYIWNNKPVTKSKAFVTIMRSYEFWQKVTYYGIIEITNM